MKNNFVYHGSPEKGLKVIEPNFSTHEKQWVYACPDPIMSALFLQRLKGDFTCIISRYKGLPTLREVYPGAFMDRYSVGGGSIYTLSAEGFESGKTDWSEEVVCEHEVKPRDEFEIDNAAVYLRDLQKQGRVLIFDKNVLLYELEEFYRRFRCRRLRK